MGLLQNGKWVDQWYDTDASGGDFKRQESRFRNWITPDGGPGPDGQRSFPAQSGRYHLFVSLACPWAHRTLIFRTLKGLESHIDITVVHPLMLENGWEFGAGGDPLYGLDFLYQLYLKADRGYEGRVTVPVLWDKETETVVNNESADVIRIFNSAFNDLTGNRDDYYPSALRSEIDSINQRVYDTVNNGVYRAGFATRQEAYEQAYDKLFESLDWLEDRLAGQTYLLGDRITEADWRLFTTLVRFDAVYHGHFKCNRNKIAEFSNLSRYLKQLYHQPGIAATVNMAHIKAHYYGSHKTINPTGIIPVGPTLAFTDR
ncbi:MAG: glutathione-dependent reductase [Porticoccaceae bacterium]|nr:glutathione-dependent reductase [Porticoccaceae bacterium]